MNKKVHVSYVVDGDTGVVYLVDNGYKVIKKFTHYDNKLINNYCEQKQLKIVEYKTVFKKGRV